MRRLAAWELKMPPANAIDWPNSGELRLPTGGPRFTRLKIFLADTPSVRV